MTIHEPEDSLVTRRMFQMDDKAQKADSCYGGPVYEERHEEHLSYKELKPGLVSGWY